MFKIKKDLEKNRIEIAISGDEIMIMLPDALTEIISQEEELATDDYLKKEIEAFEKGVHIVYIPIDKIKIEGF